MENSPIVTQAGSMNSECVNSSVNLPFIDKSRQYWDVKDLYTAMFTRIYVDPNLDNKSMDEKIKAWDNSAESSANKILQGIPFKNSWKALEIGCGIGRIIKPLREKLAVVDGVDIAPSMIDFANEYLVYPHNNGRVLVNNGFDLADLNDNDYDLVYSMIVFQHIRSASVVKSYFKEIKRVLKDNGYLRIQVFDDTKPGRGKFDEEAMYGIDYGLMGNGYKPEEFKNLLLEQGFKIENFEYNSPWIWATCMKQYNTPSINKILVSAIVSTYKSEKFIEGCLQDLVEQTLFKKGLLEIVVIDSNSPEKEKAIVERYQSRYPNIVYHRTEQRETVYQAWNRGIKLAKGKYITNANTDDRHRKDAMEVMSTYLENSPNYDIVYSNAKISYNSNERFEDNLGEHILYNSVYDTTEALLHFQFGPAPMWRISIHDQLGYFNGDYVAVGDYEFNIRFALNGLRAYFINEELVMYYKNPDSITYTFTGQSNEKRKLLSHYRKPEYLIKLYKNYIEYKNEYSLIDILQDQCLKALSYHIPGLAKKGKDEEYFSYLCDESLNVISTSYLKYDKLIVFLVDQNNFSFIYDFIKEFRKNNSVLILDSKQDKHIKFAYENANTIFIEWTERLAYIIASLPKRQRVITRLHSYEAFTEFAKTIKYENIDEIVAVSEVMIDFLRDNGIDIRARSNVKIISPGVDLKKFNFKKRSHGFDLAFVGHLIQTKNISLLIQILSKLTSIDNKYHLHIFGEFTYDAGTSPEIPKRYFNDQISKLRLEKNVTIYGYLEHDNLVRKMENINYLISTSYRESLGLNILEAMAMGIKPLIHSWPCAERIYPTEFLFNSIDDLILLINDNYNSQQYRHFVENNHDRFKSDKMLSDTILKNKKSFSELNSNNDGNLNTGSDKSLNTAYFVFWEDITTSGIIRNQVFPTLRYLSQNGFCPILFSLTRPDFQYDQKSLNDVEFQLLEWGINLEVISSNLDFYNTAAKLIPILLKKNIKLIHCRSYLASQIATLIKRETGIAYIFDMRGLMPEEGKLQRSETRGFNHDDNQDKVYEIDKENEKVLLEESDAIVVLNKTFEASVREGKRSKISKMVTIQNFVDYELFNYNKNQRLLLKEKYDFTNNSVFLFSGAMSPWYDFELIVSWSRQISEKIANSIFVVLTYVDSALLVQKTKKYFQELFEKYNISPSKFLFVNSKSDEVHYWLSVADVGLIAHKPHYKVIILPAQPIKYAEYLATGLPVLATNINNEINFVISSNEFSGWIVENRIISNYQLDKISDWIKSKDVFKNQIRNKIRQIAIEKYNYLEVGGKYLNLYKELLNLTNSATPLENPSDINNFKDECIIREKLDKIKISFFFSNFDSACPRIRIFNPISYLIQKELVEFINPYDLSKFNDSSSLDDLMEVIDIDKIRQADIVIVQREFAGKISFSNLFEMLKGSNTKIIYELDDNLISIPTYQDENEYFSQFKQNILQYLQNADIVTVSTEVLKNHFSKYNQNILVLPNQIDERLWRPIDNSISHSKIRLLFSGTLTHIKDLELIESAILKILEEYSEVVEFYYWGNITQTLKTKNNVLMASRFIDNYDDYVQILQNLNIDIGLIPLVLNDFNKSKSNIKWLEYSMCNISSIMSDICAYNSSVVNGVNGILVENSTEDWYKAIKELIENKKLRDSISSAAYSEVSNNYTLKNNANLWYDAYKHIIQTKSKIKVSIIIPVFNKSEFTKSCIESIYQQTLNRDYEIIVVDNGSTDNTLNVINQLKSKKPNFKYIKNHINLGFAKANNIGVKHAAGYYLVFLNNDTLVTGNWIDNLLDTFEYDENVGIVGAKLLYPDGTIQHAGVEIIDDRIMNLSISPWHLGYKKPDLPEFNVPKKLQAVTAACMAIRKNLFLDAGGFDEEYWNGYEDVDLCFKIRELGYEIIYQPKCEIIHYESKSGNERFVNEKDNYFRLNQKWFGKILPDRVRNKDGSFNITSIQVHKTSIIIPVFNKSELTNNCLNSIYNNTGLNSFELIIVDNGSTDDTQFVVEDFKKKYSNIKYLKNSENLGYAKANNIGVRLANYEYILLLNNDTVVTQGWLEPLIDIVENDKSVAAVGAKLLFPNEKIQHAGVAIVKDIPFGDHLVARHLYYGYDKAAPEVNELKEYQALTGACLMIRKSAYVEVGGLDEEYWNAYEDVDLCFKLREKGYKLVFQPKSVVYHLESQSGPERLSGVENSVKRLHSKWLDKIIPDLTVRIDKKVYITNNEIKIYNTYHNAITSKSINLASIIILTYNSSSTIENCLNSVINTLREGDEVIVVDNNSKDNTVEIVKGLVGNDRRFTFIQNKENIGFSAGTNVGIRLSKNRIVVMLNPDTIVNKYWLNNLTAKFEDKSITAVGPISNRVAGHQRMELYPKDDLTGWTLPDVADYFNKNFTSKTVDTKLLIGFCLAVRREFVENHGGLDEDLFLGNDDLELSWRIRANGGNLAVALDSFVYHVGQASFKSEAKSHTDKLVQESTDALYRKLVNHYGDGNVPPPIELWGIDWFKPSNPNYKLSNTKISPKSNNLTSIIILAKDQYEYTKECIDSIYKYTNSPFELILVDNGSKDEIPNYFAELKRNQANVKLITNPENVGFPKGVNQALKICDGKYILIGNNDTVVTPNWLEAMIEHLEKSPVNGLVGPISNNISGLQLDKEANYQTMQEMLDYASKVEVDNHNKIQEFPRLAFFCTLIKKEVFDKIGGLDERFSPGNYEDDDFCMRAQVAGFKAHILRYVFIHHYRSRSFAGDGNDAYRERLAKNRNVFAQKWGGTPDEIWLEGKLINPPDLYVAY